MVAAQTRAPRDTAEISLSFAPVVREAAPSVVNIYASQIVTRRVSPFAGDPFFSQFFGDLERRVPQVQNALGSGVIVSPDGIVVSNHHVVGEATDIRVVLSDRREYDAEILLSDQEADLAILRLIGASGLPAMALANSDAAQVGDLVLAIGNPFGVGQTVSSGIVSGLARSGGGLSDRSGYYIQTDAPINPGNSGGALVSMDGALLGINTSILSRSGGSNGIGFAIPSNLVAQYVAQAGEGRGRFARPWAGIRVQQVEAALASALGQPVPEGVVIAEIHPRSPFAAAGLVQGDVVVALGGAAVNAPAELDFRLATIGLGEEVEVDYLRDGTRLRARIATEEAPDDPPAIPLRLSARNAFDGLEIAALNPRLIEENDLPLSADGVIVIGARGASARLGLRPGDIIESVNGRAARDTDELARLLEGGAGDWDVTLRRDERILRLRFRG